MNKTITIKNIMEFKNPFELSIWTKKNIPNELEQEQAMREGCDYNYLIEDHSTYVIQLNKYPSYLLHHK